jgi:hypothetical protein
MLVFDIAEFTQNTSKVFDAALTEEVVLNNDEGNSYKFPYRTSPKGLIEPSTENGEIWFKIRVPAYFEPLSLLRKLQRGLVTAASMPQAVFCLIV